MRIFKGVVAWGLLLLWMFMIFNASSQTHLDSPGLFETYIGDSFPKIVAFLEANDYWIRKVGHAFVYFVLTLLAYWAFAKHSPYQVSQRPLTWAMAFSVLYAISDEYHQTLVPGRHGVYTDVLIDSIGVATAALVIYLVRRRRDD